MKTFFVSLATLLVSTDAGFTILEPSCSLIGDGKPYSDADCVKASSTFDVMYRGQLQKMKGKKIDLPACNEDNRGSKTCYSVNEALFGVNPYGEQISGMLFYKFLSTTSDSAPQQSPTGCQPIDPTFGFSDNDANPTRKILLVDRGTCSFVRKVRMAQVCVSFIITCQDKLFILFRLIDL